MLPCYNDITKSKKMQLINNFEEMTFEGEKDNNYILEYEDSPSKNIYWLMNGEILVYKKMNI